MPIGVRAAKRGLPPIPAFGIGWLYPVCPRPANLAIPSAPRAPRGWPNNAWNICWYNTFEWPVSLRAQKSVWSSSATAASIRGLQSRSPGKSRRAARQPSWTRPKLMLERILKRTSSTFCNEHTNWWCCLRLGLWNGLTFGPRSGPRGAAAFRLWLYCSGSRRRSCRRVQAFQCC